MKESSGAMLLKTRSCGRSWSHVHEQDQLRSRRNVIFTTTPQPCKKLLRFATIPYHLATIPYHLACHHAKHLACHHAKNYTLQEWNSCHVFTSRFPATPSISVRTVMVQAYAQNRGGQTFSLRATLLWQYLAKDQLQQTTVWFYTYKR